METTIEHIDKRIKIHTMIREATPKSDRYSDNFEIQTNFSQEFDCDCDIEDAKKKVVDGAITAFVAAKNGFLSQKGDYIHKSEVDKKYVSREEANKAVLEERSKKTNGLDIKERIQKIAEIK